MFPIKPAHIRRAKFSSKLFPRLNSSIGLETSKIGNFQQDFDGETFCGGRSKNRDLLTFFGCILETDTSASFAQLPLFRRALKKLTDLVEHELELIGAQEVLLPTLVPQNLWMKSDRLSRQPNALDHVYKFTDNKDNQMLLGPTFEESITRLIASLDTIKETELPLLLYQSSSKFRQEPNPRFGLVRNNEFLMNDTYSFDINLEQATDTYQRVSKAYERIFNRLALPCLKILSDPGSIGGKYSHEYQLPVSSGEDTIVVCNSCHEAYNDELLKLKKQSSDQMCPNCESKDVSRSQALELGHTFLLSDTYSKPLKAKFTVSTGGGRSFLEMGCYGLGLTRILAAGIDSMSIIPGQDSKDLLQLRWPSEVEPYKLGIVTPAKRSKQYHGGSSEFVEKLVHNILDRTRKLDMLIEDRDKEGILQRILKLRSLGIPNIVIVGQRFLQENPEVELLSLSDDKKSYEQRWFSEDQLCDYLGTLE